MPKAFVQTGQLIYEKIQSGSLDISSESSGIKLGPMNAGTTDYTKGGRQENNPDDGCC